ncbi:MAG: cytochrome b [Ramlibacter sp.]
MQPARDPSTKTQRYGAFAVLLHWAVALALLGQLALGWRMLGLPKSPPGLRAGWFNVHKSIGLAIAALVLVRWAWRCTHRVAVPPLLPPWQQRAARINHALLYLLMLLIPLSGYLGSAFSGYPVKFFGLVLPAWAPAWPAAKAFLSGTHLACIWLFMALVLVHVAAALWHWARRDEVAMRMGLPLALERP